MCVCVLCVFRVRMGRCSPSSHPRGRWSIVLESRYGVTPLKNIGTLFVGPRSANAVRITLKGIGAADESLSISCMCCEPDESAKAVVRTWWPGRQVVGVAQDDDAAQRFLDVRSELSR